MERIDLRDERGFELEAVPASQAVGRGRLVKARFIGGLVREGGGSRCSLNLRLPKGVGEIEAKKPKEVVGVLRGRTRWVRDASLEVNWPSVESYNAEIREEADKRPPLRQAGRAREGVKMPT